MGYKDPAAQRAYQRDWLKRRRDRFFAGKVCAECATTNSLELDHIDPAGKASHHLWSWSASRREAELAKCQVLCHACHEEKTAVENGRDDPIPHGTHSGYSKHGCRCSDCRSAHAAYQREWLQQRKFAR